MEKIFTPEFTRIQGFFFHPMCLSKNFYEVDMN